MTYPYQSENRVSIRVTTDIRCEMKFVSHRKEPGLSEDISTGTVNSLSGGGLQLTAPLPDLAWIAQLITQNVMIGVKIPLPGYNRPVAAICRVVWVDRVKNDANGPLFAQFVLEFKEISTVDVDIVLDYVIHRLMA